MTKTVINLLDECLDVELWGAHEDKTFADLDNREQNRLLRITNSAVDSLYRSFIVEQRIVYLRQHFDKCYYKFDGTDEDIQESISDYYRFKKDQSNGCKALEDFYKILAVLSPAGDEVPFNQDNKDMTIYMVNWNTMYLDVPIDTGFWQIVYKTKAPSISTGDEVLDLPEVAYNYLRCKIAHYYFSGQSGQDVSQKLQSLENEMRSYLQIIEDEDLFGTTKNYAPQQDILQGWP